MSRLQILPAAALLFFCLWTALLARFKGYSATCWFLGGGLVGVAVLCRLKAAGPDDRARKTRVNRLGLLMSGLSIAGIWFALRCCKGAFVPT